MKNKDLFFMHKQIFFLFLSLFFVFCFSCSDSSPQISGIFKTLIYEFNSEDEKANIRLSVFLTPSQDVRRSKSMEVTHHDSQFVWKINTPQVYAHENKNYIGHSSLIVPEDFIFPEGLFEVAYYDVADRKITENINVTPLKSMMETEEGFVKASDVRSKKTGTECTQKKIIICDEIGKEIFFGFYSSKLDSNDKILKLFPDAVTKRIYYCNQNNSVGILLPTENIKN